jgi:quercetin dioxygenase-like cupin family protein
VDKYSLDDLAREHLDKATRAATGRSATVVFGGHEQVLRQTLIALRASTWLNEHENPGETTLLVLRGRVRLHVGPDTSEGSSGDLLIIPPARHSLEAIEDSVVLLTVAK